MGVFYGLSDKFLLEINYAPTQFNNVSVPLLKITDDNEGATILSNRTSENEYTDNGLSTVTVLDDTGENRVILDDNTARYFPNFSTKISVEQLQTSNIGLSYISVRLHLLSGYSIQDLAGLCFDIWTTSSTGKKIYLLKQSFLKTQINRYKYNFAPKHIGDLFYDKYLEFFIIDYSNILSSGVNLGFFADKINFSSDSVINAALSTINSVDYSNGYGVIDVLDVKTISFSPRDEFSSLSAFITENKKGYIEYCAKWDGGSIEQIIYGINSVNGNEYIIVHELDIYEQNGQSLKLVDRISQIQNSDFDKTKRLRPILSEYADGGMKVNYTVRLYNKSNGDSIIKDSTISIMNISPYLEEVLKINVVQTTNPIKVYNKIVSNEAQKITENKLVKVVVPMYVNACNVVLETGYLLPLTQYDNIYQLKIFNKLQDGSLHIFPIDPKIMHRMVFPRNGGNNIEVKEILDQNARTYGILTFKISLDVARLIKANQITTYSIITDTTSNTTQLINGDIKYNG